MARRLDRVTGERTAFLPVSFSDKRHCTVLCPATLSTRSLVRVVVRIIRHRTNRVLTHWPDHCSRSSSSSRSVGTAGHPSASGSFRSDDCDCDWSDGSVHGSAAVGAAQGNHCATLAEQQRTAIRDRSQSAVAAPTQPPVRHGDCSSGGSGAATQHDITAVHEQHGAAHSYCTHSADDSGSAAARAATAAAGAAAAARRSAAARWSAGSGCSDASERSHHDRRIDGAVIRSGNDHLQHRRSLRNQHGTNDKLHGTGLGTLAAVRASIERNIDSH